MQCRQHQVPGQGRLHCDLGGLQVPDFTHHDHIGVLPENGAQPPGKGHIHFGINLGLADTGQHVLNGIFYGEDIPGALVDAGKPGIQGGGLTGPGWPGDQNNAVWTCQTATIGGGHLLIHIELFQFQLSRLLIQQPQNNALAVG